MPISFKEIGPETLNVSGTRAPDEKGRTDILSAPLK